VYEAPESEPIDIVRAARPAVGATCEQCRQPVVNSASADEMATGFAHELCGHEMWLVKTFIDEFVNRMETFALELFFIVLGFFQMTLACS
jgi:hypothetical protein